MKRILGALLLLLLIGCGESGSDEKKNEQEVVFNQNLADELKKMAKIDQIAANKPRGKYAEMPYEEWKSFKDSVFTTHQARLKHIFDQYGFVGYDLAGTEGSHNFWLMVQHSDHTPDFQRKVLEKMKIEVEKGNAKPSNYGLLVDRVRINTGEKQVYGTQITFDFKTAQAYPKSLEDSINVNERRKSIGLEPIEVYLNRMTEMHFEMNKEIYLKKGVTEPKLYELENNTSR